MITHLIAVDPGDRHVGVAFFEAETADPWAAENALEWECVDAQEWKPQEFEDGLASALLAGDVQALVFERFRLYGDKAQEQTGSEFETSQLIGVMKFLVRIHNAHATRHAQAERDLNGLLPCEQRGQSCADPRVAPKPVVIHGQMADIKVPTRAILRKRGVKSTAARLKAGGHAADAELHGWKYLLDRPS